MRKLLALSAIVLLASCGQHGGGSIGATCPYKWVPPKQYDHEPNPYPVIAELDLWDIDKKCREGTGYVAADYTSHGRISGCFRYTDPPYKVPMVVVAKVNPSEGINQACHDAGLRHEFGHDNGWGSNHAGGVSA